MRHSKTSIQPKSQEVNCSWIDSNGPASANRPNKSQKVQLLPRTDLSPYFRIISFLRAMYQKISNNRISVFRGLHPKARCYFTPGVGRGDETHQLLRLYRGFYLQKGRSQQKRSESYFLHGKRGAASFNVLRILQTTYLDILCNG